MKLSTRNQWKGTVKSIAVGVVNSEVQVAIAENVTITAIITNGAIKNLNLKLSDAVVALVKSSEVILGSDIGAISARNVLTGNVSELLIGAVNAEVTIVLGDGATVTSIITKSSAERLGITVGKEISAIIKASSVIIGKD